MAAGISTDSSTRVRRSAAVSLLVLLLTAASTRHAAAADGKQLIDAIWARYRTVGTERQESEILVVKAPHAAPYTRAEVETLARDGGSGVDRKRAVHHVRYATDRRDMLHLLFSLPAQDAGLGLLVARDPDGTQDDLWLYMPGYHRVRRIPASSDQRFAGTDLLYEDVRAFLGEHTSAFTYSTPTTEQVDGRACDLVIATPNAGTSTAYARRKLWIDQAWGLPVRAELADSDGKPWKVLRNTEVRAVAPGVHRADLIEMRDLERESATLVLVTKRAVGVEIRPQVFTEDYLMHPGND
jgi:hypothetical protein